MDSKDVSDNDQITAWMKQWQLSADKAGQRKGQKVRDHPPAEKLILSFMMKLEMVSMRASALSLQQTGATLATSQLPPPYPPCILSVHELEPIAIADMRLETHHRGKMTLVRARTPPQRMTAIMAIVQDEQGTAVLLQLYYQPEEAVVPAEQILQPDVFYILKEPFFKLATDGSYALRVDHVSDVVRLEITDDRIPSKWRRPQLMLGQTSEGIRQQGNEAVQKEKWAEAHRLYSSAIEAAESLEEKRLAYLNRSLANIKLGRPEQALSDAKHGSDDVSVSEKGLFRQARALYELGEFQQCLDTLRRLTATYPDNKAAAVELDRAKARCREQQTGKYNFGKMYKQVQHTPPLVDCATFSGPVEIRSSPGRGRGLFTTIPVSAGQLLVCEKAFAYSYAGEDQPGHQTFLVNMHTKKAVMGGQAGLLTQLMQKLYHSPKALQLYSELHHGDHAKPQASEVDGHPVVDSFLVEQIRALNSFGAPRTSRESFTKRLTQLGDPEDNSAAKYTTCGIWLLASRVNHSCIGNCRRSFIGDIQIIRAAHDLEIGTELFFGYRSPNLVESYNDVQKDLSSWGFSCNCDLCERKKDTPPPVLRSRKKLFADLKKTMGGADGTNAAAAKQLLEQIEKLCPAAEASHGQLQLCDPYLALGFNFVSEGKPVDGISMIVRGLEVAGFVITATLPTGDTNGAKLEVKEWGFTHDITVWAFLYLFRVYRRLAPEVSPVARRYVGVAYSIVVGEKETLDDEFPELAV